MRWCHLSLVCVCPVTVATTFRLMDILAGSTRVFDVRGDVQTSINGGLWVQQGGASYTGGLQVHSTQCVVMGSSGVVGDGKYHVYIFTHSTRTTHTTDRHTYLRTHQPPYTQAIKCCEAVALAS